MKIVSWISVFIFLASTSFSQEEIVVSYLDDSFGVTEEGYAEFIEEINGLLSNPIAFNKIRKDELRRIPFLSEGQIGIIISVRDTLENSHNWEDIFNLIEASQELRKLLPKLIILRDSTNSYAGYRSPVRIQSMSTWWQNIEKSEGYKRKGMYTPFIGPDYGLRSRLMVAGRDFEIKLIAESDPGESDFRKPDHMSAGILVSPQRSLKMVFGDYHFNAGFGLGMSTRSVFRSWKADPHSQIKRGSGLSLHGGGAETKFLRGSAISYGKGPFEGKVFVSVKNLDATIKDGENQYFSGIYSSGLHRSESEIYKHNNISEEISGISVGYTGDRFEVGGLLAHFQFSEKFKLTESNSWPLPEPNYDDKAKRYSIWGRGLIGNGMLLGEFSSSSTKGYAMEIAWSGFYSGGIAYSLIFETCKSGFFSHNSQVASSIIKNQGYQRGRINIQYQARKKLNFISEFGLEGIVDPFLIPTNDDYYFKTAIMYKFSGLSIESVLKLESEKFNSKFKIKELDTDKSFYYQAEIGFSSSSPTMIINNPGTYVSSRIRYRCFNGKLNFQAGLSFFTGSEFSTPFYTYEPDVYYGMSLPSLSGTGSRAFILIQYQLLKILKVETKISRLDYDDRGLIGAGNDLIPHNHKTTVKVQLIYRTKYEL